jgi:hypothetical protein
MWIMIREMLINEKVKYQILKGYSREIFTSGFFIKKPSSLLICDLKQLWT